MRLLLRLSVASCLTLTAVVAPACVTSSSNTMTAAAGRAVEYFPLAVGNRATWRVQPGPEQPQEVVIVKQDDRGFFVDNRGFAVAPRSDGIFDGQRFVLQDPLVVDHAWSAKPKDQPAETYKITATDVSVTVGAGTFTDCVQVEGEQPGVDPNTGRRGKVLISWTYAKNVGLIQVVQRTQLDGEAPVTVAKMELLSFTPASSSDPPSAQP